ncbi:MULTISPECIES: 3'-5' exonuclease [unclassified Halorhodospira]|uniref:3'-5' exonuclease n=1 Tax=unclassified Halorhodospira TaxID=2626748 RepID=UPI001EE79E03|nr:MULTISPECIES: 3'-5' exonuclease [unclassified Halorhodospira]MCG5539788.1 3'-5' exonuclease [Halorhodospira sp. M39old]MCG5544762.1 3'-5' exonuclease [Halorhodospira sp. M38]
MNVLAFDIETVPDLAGGRVVYGLDGLEDTDVSRAMAARRRQETGNEFPRLHLHRVVAISLAGLVEGRFRVWSLGTPEDGEQILLERFFEGLDRYVPNLVSWNGNGFDIPVLHHRALINGVSAPRYWETGDNDRAFRFNNYLNRYHDRHLDLMDVLSSFQMRGAAPLDEVATLCGLPGKMGMSGGAVADAVARGEIEAVRNYCETDVLNTYLLYLRFQYFRGALDREDYQRETDRVAAALEATDRPHLSSFLEAWRGA